MEILKYIDKEVGKIEKQKHNKNYRIEKLGSDIKKLENKLNRETEKESVIGHAPFFCTKPYIGNLSRYFNG